MNLFFLKMHWLIIRLPTVSFSSKAIRKNTKQAQEHDCDRDGDATSC